MKTVQELIEEKKKYDLNVLKEDLITAYNMISLHIKQLDYAIKEIKQISGKGPKDIDRIQNWKLLRQNLKDAERLLHEAFYQQNRVEAYFRNKEIE